MGDPVTAMMAVSLFAGAASSAKQQSNARHQAKKQREAQEKQLGEQRILDAASQRMMSRADEDVADVEVGNLSVGARTNKGKRQVQKAAPSTGLRVG